MLFLKKMLKITCLTSDNTMLNTIKKSMKFKITYLHTKNVLNIIYYKPLLERMLIQFMQE